MDAQAAARMGDEIAHGFGVAAMVAGAVVGAVVGAAVIGAVAATGGLAAVILGGAIAAGGLSMGQLVKGITTIFNLPEPTSGVLARGSPNVFINGRPAMRAGSDIAAACSGLPFNHPPWPGAVLIAQGSRVVGINSQPAGRLSNKLVCGAHIKSGSPNVFIGGPDAQVAMVLDLDSWLHTGLEVLGLGALVGGGLLAAAAGVAALGTFLGVSGGFMAGFEGLGRLGDRLGPGYRDLLQGAAGMAALLAGPKMAKQSWGGQNPDTLAAVKRMPAEFQSEYAAAKSAGWTKPNGETWWPPNDGAVGTPVKTNLPPDTPLDRFGSENGSYLSPKGEAFEQRAMPGVPEKPPSDYIVKQSLPVEKAEIAPWFDQPGGGTQYKLRPPEDWNVEIDGPFNVAAAKKYGYLGDE